MPLTVVLRVRQELLTYTHRSGSLVSQVPRRVILNVKVQAFERRVLAHWPHVTIWGGGRDGRQTLGAFSEEAKAKVRGFVDVDPKKIAEGSYWHVASRTRVPVIHFSEAKPPLVMCVAMGRTGGAFEANVASLGLRETVDYWHFN